LLDAELLAEVYVELIGARQAKLVLADAAASRPGADNGIVALRARPSALSPRITPAEREEHRRFVATLGATAIWRDYLGERARTHDTE
jgi:DNA polymerase-3 subunit epsilon